MTRAACRGARARRASRIALLLPSTLLCACSWLQDKMTEPAAEKPTARSEGHLNRKPGDDELGPDERMLLADYTDANAARLALETKLAELQQKLDATRAELTQTQDVRDRERTGRAAADAELARLRNLLQDREAKILALHIEKAKQTQELLSLRIEAAERQGGEAAHGSETPANPARGGH